MAKLSASNQDEEWKEWGIDAAHASGGKRGKEGCHHHEPYQFSFSRLKESS